METCQAKSTFRQQVFEPVRCGQSRTGPDVFSLSADRVVKPFENVPYIATLTQTDAAKRHGVSVRTIHRMDQRGELRGVKRGGLKHYSVAELDRVFGAK